MSREVRVVFDRASRKFVSEETIAGHIEVVIGETTHCEELIISLAWCTRGHGNPVLGEWGVIRLFEGTWEPGTYRYPFTLVAPNGPFSYNGYFLDVEWLLHAHANIEEDIPIDILETFFLSPSNKGQFDDAQRASVNASNALREKVNEYKPWHLALAGVTLIFLGLIAAGVTGIEENVYLGGFSVMLGMGCLGAMASKEVDRLGDVDIYLNPSAIFPGASINTLLLFVPKRRLMVEKITATLRGQEIVHRGEGQKRTTQRHVFFEEEYLMSEAQELRQGQLVQASTNFKLDEKTPLSFHAKDNEIVWEIEYHIELARWPDWTETRYLVIGPPTPMA